MHALLQRGAPPAAGTDLVAEAVTYRLTRERRNQEPGETS